jgi:hypothetical protein
MIFPAFHTSYFSVGLRDKIKGGFNATVNFKVAQTEFGQTWWNYTQGRILGQEVTDGYSLSNMNC